MDSKQQRKYNRIWRYRVKMQIMDNIGNHRNWIDKLYMWCETDVTDSEWKVFERSYDRIEMKVLWEFAFKHEEDAVLFRLCNS